jgi:hypothetical protein
LARTSLGGFQRLATADFDARQKAVSDLVKPIRDTLGKVDEKLQAIEKECDKPWRSGDRAPSADDTSGFLRFLTIGNTPSLSQAERRGFEPRLALQIC